MKMPLFVPFLTSKKFFLIMLLFCSLFVQVIRASGFVKLSGNNLAGSVKLNDFTMSLKWSNIGNLHMYLIQVSMFIMLTRIKIKSSRLSQV